MLRALHVRDVRVSVIAPVRNDRLVDHASVQELLAAMQANETPDGTRILRRFRAEMNTLGVSMDFVYWQMPRKWSQSFGPPGHRQWRSIPAHIADYAHWIAAELLFARGFGLRPAAVELTNEPDGGWNTFFTPRQYGELVLRTRRAMDENGLHGILIEGPGTSKVHSIGPYLAELISTGRLALLGRVSVHDYDTIAFPAPAGLSGLPPGLQSRLGTLPIFVTEFSSTRPEWRQPPYDTDLSERGGAHSAADSLPYAVSVAGEAVQLISDGAASVYVWQLEDPGWAHDSFGMLDVNGRARPVATALASIFATVPTGATVFPSSPRRAGLAAAAFARGGSLMVVLVNLSDAPRIVRLDLYAVATGRAAVDTVTAFPAASAKPGRRYPPNADIPLPADSLVLLRTRAG